MEVAVLLSPGVTAFEALGSYGVFRRAPGTTVRMVAEEPGRVQAHGSKVALVAECSYRDVDVADVIVVPGGLGVRRLIDDQDVATWLRTKHETSQWTIGISTGSALLSEAGILDGQDATTHWLATDLLEARGVHAVPERMVRSGRVVTATGAVSGLEAALFVVGRVRGQATTDEIRRHLDAELTGQLAADKPVDVETLADLGAVEVGRGPSPYDIGGTSSTASTSRRSGRRRGGGSGRIEVIDRSPR